MATPFNADTWKKVSDSPLPVQVGADFQVVSGIAGASYHPRSRTLQIFGQSAHTATGFCNAAAISYDGGANWSLNGPGATHEGNAAGQQVTAVWSLDTPFGLYHYQLRIDAVHSFFLADGSLQSGGITMYVSGPDVPAMTPIQTLYTWPHIIADPANTGGNNIFSTFPTVAPPIKIAGSGPGGKDAWWMVVGVRLDVGGSNNRQTFHFEDLWRSTDGIHWEKVRDLIGTPAGLATFSAFFRSASGRLILAGGSAGAYTDGAGDPIGATWVGINSPGILNGSFIPMFGGTWASAKNGSLISGGFVVLSCDDAANFFAAPASPDIPLNSMGFLLKLGPTECLLITAGFNSPTTETTAYYSADGGETFISGGVWLSTVVGERPRAAFMRSNGTPLVVTQDRVFISTDTARGVAGKRTVCPLANAGLAAARPLVICGHPLQNNLCEDH